MTRVASADLLFTLSEPLCDFVLVPWRWARPRRARRHGPTNGCPCLLATEISCFHIHSRRHQHHERYRQDASNVLGSGFMDIWVVSLGFMEPLVYFYWVGPQSIGRF